MPAGVVRVKGVLAFDEDRLTRSVSRATVLLEGILAFRFPRSRSQMFTRVPITARLAGPNHQQVMCHKHLFQGQLTSDAIHSCMLYGQLQFMPSPPCSMSAGGS